ncbi:hypothetical protein KI387_022700, partial [Taxus chinensis]
MTDVPKHGRIPVVVHVHGGIHKSQSDGHSFSRFTEGFNETGIAWKKPTYHCSNIQHPGNMRNHDHASGLTRINILAVLYGAYVLSNFKVEKCLMLPSSRAYDHPLVVFDWSFAKDEYLFMNSTGNNPHIHPQWHIVWLWRFVCVQPEYFGDTIIVNGKAWPYSKVKRRKYRFRKCDIEKHAQGRSFAGPPNERTWKNVFKMRPGFMTTILVKFSPIHTNGSYPFNATVEPGCVYQCH